MDLDILPFAEIHECKNPAITSFSFFVCYFMWKKIKLW